MDTDLVEMDIPSIDFRIEVVYSNLESRSIKRHKIKWNADIEEMEDILHEKHEDLFYSNHKTVSLKTIQSFQCKRKVIQIVIGRTQSGKTAGMLCIMNDYVNENIFDPDNIYIITGLSSTDWERQTKKRMPFNLDKNIFHNGQLKDFKKFYSYCSQKLKRAGSSQRTELLC